MTTTRACLPVAAVVHRSAFPAARDAIRLAAHASARRRFSSEHQAERPSHSSLAPAMRLRTELQAHDDGGDFKDQTFGWPESQAAGGVDRPRSFSGKGAAPSAAAMRPCGVMADDNTGAFQVGQTGLIVRIPEAEPAVRRWRDRFDPSAEAGVPAHVTVLFPFRSNSWCTTARSGRNERPSPSEDETAREARLRLLRADVGSAPLVDMERALTPSFLGRWFRAQEATP